MSSEDDQNELEERKGELWSMDEVRGGGGTATTDAEDMEVREDTSDTSESDDKADTSDTNGIVDESPILTDSEIKDSSDTTDTSGAPDTSDVEDASVEAEEAPVSQAEGDTVRQMALDAEDKGLAVRDLHNVNVYLFESVYHDMRTKFKELDTEYYAAHGEDLSKNKDFFNAVFRAGLQSPQLKKELEIE